ncbi:hypothetical protein ACW2Q0_23420 [Nocardia sp. R16R-3T]
MALTVTAQHGQAFRIAEQRLITAGGRAQGPDASAIIEINPFRNGVDQIDPGATRTIRLAFLPGKDENDENADVASQLVPHTARRLPA